MTHACLIIRIENFNASNIVSGDFCSAAVNARYARIKGQVLPETYRRPKRAGKRQGVAA